MRIGLQRNQAPGDQLDKSLFELICSLNEPDKSNLNLQVRLIH